MVLDYKCYRKLDVIEEELKREVGADAEEVEERVGGYDQTKRCLRFTQGSASCLLVLRYYG